MYMLIAKRANRIESLLIRIDQEDVWFHALQAKPVRLHTVLGAPFV